MEKLKQLPQKQLKLILILVTLVIVVCSYYFGYQKYSSRAEDLDKENKSLFITRNELQEKNRNKDIYINEINDMKDKAEALLEAFPSGLTQDKIIMFIYDLANNTGLELTSLNLGDIELFYPTAGPDMTDVEELLGYKARVTLSYSSTYETFKKWVSHIHDYDERMNIPTFNAAFNHTTGKLSGTMTIDMYALGGTGKEFVDSIIDGLPVGTDNIFGTFEKPIDYE